MPPQFQFYHLERRTLEEALPALLEAALADGWRAVVQAASSEEAEVLNERLWTYSDESFLPHGGARDGEAEAQPVFLTDGDASPNAARLRVLLAGVEAARFAAGPLAAAHERVIVMFDGRDEGAKAEARRQWGLVRGAGAQVSYWREAENGGWERAR